MPWSSERNFVAVLLMTLTSYGGLVCKPYANAGAPHVRVVFPFDKRCRTCDDKKNRETPMANAPDCA